jgi:hypothetical protein
MTEAPAGGRSSPHSPVFGRLVAWCVFVGALAALGYAAHFAEPDGPAEDVLYRWPTAVAGAVQYLLMAGIALAIARPLGRDSLGLRRPESWGRAAALIVGSLVAIFIAAGILGRFLDAGQEQGLVPDGWDSSRAAPFAANFLVVVVAAPLVEEFIFRGVGFCLFSQVAGPAVAIAVTSLAFGLAHGLVVALPVLSLFGVVLGWLRSKTGSLYPPMILHGTFNAAALIAAVTMGSS